MACYVKFAVSGPDIVCEEFDGELVVLDLKTGCYFSFNRSASAIWDLLTAGIAPAVIEEALGQAVSPLVDNLVEHNLLVALDEPGERQLDGAVLASLRSVQDAPVVEAFDDLADLIRADPVHEVDEAAGWPHQKEAVSF
ncbi:PqqD family protein [Breoghania sp.]|uniref:PqqD family protein n=1 Tax=Breoghania sp. TaxID=2065378 RepID=UPI002AA76A4F|nr:PqqD family protein [Breoghania sp.]